jgi:hypothetical protein
MVFVGAVCRRQWRRRHSLRTMSSSAVYLTWEAVALLCLCSSRIMVVGQATKGGPYLSIADSMVIRNLGACERVKSQAKQFCVTQKCGCQVSPLCTRECDDTPTGLNGSTTRAWCRSGCEYCTNSSSSSSSNRSSDAWNDELGRGEGRLRNKPNASSSSTTVCGTVDVGIASGYCFEPYPKMLTLRSVHYSWKYTTGPRSGSSVTFVVGFVHVTPNVEELEKEKPYMDTPVCSVDVNHTACKACTVVACNNGASHGLQIDCTNVEVGATATPCTGRGGEGYVSLNASVEQESILAPLTFAHWGCLQNTTVLGPNATFDVLKDSFYH